MLIITNAIPIGRKAMLPLIAATIMKIIPLIEKNIAAVLYDFEFLDDLASTKKVFSFIQSRIEFIPYSWGSQ